ncbi:MAG: hypothetical protein ACRENL_00135 [Candidatus Dormibacteria bacterium]
MPWATQDGYSVRFDWGAGGVARLAPEVRVIVIVGVLRFTIAVSTAVDGGARVFPFRSDHENLAAFALSRSAIVADGTGPQGFSL